MSTTRSDRPAAPSIIGGPALIGADVTIACLIIAPLLELIEQVLSPLAGTSTLADLAAIDVHRIRFTVLVWCGLLAVVAYIPAFLGLGSAGLARSPRLARVGAGAAVVSMLGFSGVRMMQAVQLQMVAEDLDRPIAARLVDHAGTNALGLPLLIMFLGGSVVGLGALAISLWLTGFPRPALGLLALFPVADLVATGHVGTIVSHAIVLVALVWLAAALRSRQPRFDGLLPRFRPEATAV